MDELAELRIRARQDEIRMLNNRVRFSQILRLVGQFSLACFIILVVVLSCEARADYRPQFVNRTLNKTIVVDGGRRTTIPGTPGTTFKFKEREHDYYRGPGSCVIPYRWSDGGRHRLRRTRDCTPGRR